MTSSTRSSEPVRESLFRAAAQLERATDGPHPGSEAWYGEVRSAIRGCTLAVETPDDLVEDLRQAFSAIAR